MIRAASRRLIFTTKRTKGTKPKRVFACLALFAVINNLHEQPDRQEREGLLGLGFVPFARFVVKQTRLGQP